MKNFEIILLLTLVFLVNGCSNDEDSPTPLHKDFQDIEIEIINTNSETTKNDGIEIELTLDNLEYSKIPSATEWDEIKTFSSFYLCKKIVKQDIERRIIKFQQRRVIFSFFLKDLNNNNEYLSPCTVVLRINGQQKEVYQTGADLGKIWGVNYQEMK